MEGGAGAVLVEVLIMAPASDPHRAGRIPRGDTVGMNRPGPLSSPRRMRAPGAAREPVATRTPTRQPRRSRPDRPRPSRILCPSRSSPAARDRTAPSPATGLPGPAIDATLSWRAVAARDWTARPPASGLPGPAIDATLSRWAVAARDWIARAAATVVRIATDLYDRADALREIVT